METYADSIWSEATDSGIIHRSLVHDVLKDHGLRFNVYVKETTDSVFPVDHASRVLEYCGY